MVNFDNDENLGAVVSKKELFSEIAEDTKISKHQLDIAAGKLNISRLCGFKFHSSVQTNYPDFAIAFVCKYRSQINRQQKKYVEGQWTIPSRWFAFRLIDGFKKIMIVDVDAIATMYNFDIAKFFKSDYWKNGIVELEKTVRNGLPKFDAFLRQNLTSKKEQQDALDELRAIELSLPLMKKRMFENKNYNGVLTDMNLYEGKDNMQSDSYTIEELIDVLNRKPKDKKVMFVLDGNKFEDKQVVDIKSIGDDNTDSIFIHLKPGYMMENMKQVFEGEKINFAKLGQECNRIYSKCKKAGQIDIADAERVRDIMQRFNDGALAFDAQTKQCVEACCIALKELLAVGSKQLSNVAINAIDYATDLLAKQTRKSVFFDMSELAIKLLALGLTKENNQKVANEAEQQKQAELDEAIEEAVKNIYK